MGNYSESVMASHVVQWLVDQHWEVYQEVKLGSAVADIVAVRYGLVWIVECKTTLSMKVLEQASNWGAHFRSVAVLKAKGRERHFAEKIAHQYLMLGILEVDGRRVIETCAPPLMREYHGSAKRIISDLKEEQKTWCQAGSSNGGYYTPYRDTIERVKRFVAAHPGCTLKEIMEELGKGHYSSVASAKSNLPKALRDFEGDWCTIEKINNQVRYFLKDGAVSAPGYQNLRIG